MSSLFYGIDGKFYNNNLITNTKKLKNIEYMTDITQFDKQSIQYVMKIITANSTFDITTLPAVGSLQIEMVGGGGCGGGDKNIYDYKFHGGCGGGGAGGYIKFNLDTSFIDMTKKTNFLYAIGHGGTKQYNGSNTIIKITTKDNTVIVFKAGGGSGGNVGKSGDTVPEKLVSGTGGDGGRSIVKNPPGTKIIQYIGNPLIIPGGCGGNGTPHTTSTSDISGEVAKLGVHLDFSGGVGGASFFGGGGSTLTTPGQIPYGAGGAGAGNRTTKSPGQPGQSGIIIITYKMIVPRPTSMPTQMPTVTQMPTDDFIESTELT